MSDQITQTFKKIFPTSHKRITQLLEMLIPLVKKNFRRKRCRGKKKMSMKRLLAAIFYKIKTGCPWRQLPDFFGKWRTIYGWYRKLATQHFWKILYAKLLEFLQAVIPGLIERVIFDGSLVPAKNGGSHAKRNPRSQNKSVVNVMFMTNGKGLGLNLLIARGTMHDSKLLCPLYKASAALFKGKPPRVAHADKGFDAKATRCFLLTHSCEPRIPCRKRRGGLPPNNRKDRIRGRIECFFGRLKQFKAILITFNRTIESIEADIFVAMLAILSEKTSPRNLKMCFQSA